MRKLGINCGCFPGVPSIDGIPLAKAAGFDCFFTGYTDDETCGKIADVADRNGLIYDTIHAPFKHINSMWLPGDTGDEYTAMLCQCADTCAHYGIPVMIVHLSSGVDAPCVNDLGHARFDRLVEHAGEVGVKIAFENQRKLANIAFVFELYDKLPQVGFCWDNGHEACFSPGREYMPLFANKLIALHIHDNMREYNKDMHYLPFDGVIDFKHVAEQIKASGYTGTLMLETLPRKSDLYTHLTPEQFFAKAHAAADKLRTMTDGE